VIEDQAQGPVGALHGGGVSDDASPPREAQSAELTALVRRACRNEPAAWDELVSRYGRRLYALGLSRLRSVHGAEDLAQSVFATLAEHLTGGRYTEEGRFEAWLFRIANNRVRDVAKRRARDRTTETEHELARQHDQPTEKDESARALRRAVAELPEAEQEVLSMRHQAQMSFHSIADALGQPLGTVLARHHRALGKLREMLKDAGTES